MADEGKETQGLEFKTGKELMTFLGDLEGQINNLQQTIDKMQPVKEEETEEKEEKEKEPEEKSEEEISEIDKLLQSE